MKTGLFFIFFSDNPLFPSYYYYKFNSNTSGEGVEKEPKGLLTTSNHSKY